MKQETLLLDNTPIVSQDYDEDAKILNSKITNPTVKNLAIVAKLGAGKSSLIETYLKKYRTKKKFYKKKYFSTDNKFDKKAYKSDKKFYKKNIKQNLKSQFVKISLSTFNGKDYTEEEVERSILQQLLYSQNKEKLPNSKIERTNKPSIWKTVLFSSLLTIFIISSVLFGTELSSLQVFPNIKWVKYLFLGLMALSFGLLLFNAIYYKSFKRIKYKDFELETNSTNNSGSIINKLIDEILYFFECINVDLVIFEDLDRLSNKEIFVKLRELNTIINNSSNKRCNKVTFLYAVKSELLEDVEQRAKFFDFILSIVPIVNPTTTEEKIREIIKYVGKNDEKIKLTEEFIKDISLYIPDMRILKNTFNDYLVTRKRVVNDKNQNRINNEKLFTLSLYRNLFPIEYSKLENKQGVLSLLLNKKILLDICAKEINNELINLETQIEDSKKEQLESFEELKLILKGVATDAPYIYRTPKYKISAITTFENVNFDYLEHPRYSGYSVELNPEIRGKFSSINFLQREKQIELKNETNRQTIYEKIEKLKKDKQKIFNLSFDDLVDRLGIETIFNNEHIKESQDFINDTQDIKFLNFIKFIIKNKYVDDKYLEYTNNFSSSIISDGDIEFIKNIQNGNSKYDYQIENIVEVINRLKRDDFRYVSIINKSILKNIDLISDKVKKQNLLNTISNLSNIEFDMIINFISTEMDDEIVKLIINLKDDINLCKKIISSNLTMFKKDLALNAIFNQVEDVSLLNIETCITNYFSLKDNLSNIFNNLDFDKCKKILNQTKPKFQNLNFSLCLEEVMEFIIQNNYYELNIDNLCFVLNVKEIEKEQYLADVKKFISEDVVEDYISKNINIFIEKVLMNEIVPDSVENSKFVLDLILNEFVDLDCKRKLICKFNILIEKVDSINNNLYQDVLLTNKINSSWNNLLFLYDNFENKELLFEFIINNIEHLHVIELDESNKNLILDLINFKDIDENKLISFCTKISGNLALCEIVNEQNALILLKQQKIVFSQSDFNILIEHEILLIDYLKCFSNEILENINVFFTNKITNEIINKILFSNIIPNKLKQKIIVQFSTKLQIIGFEDEYYELFTKNKFIIKDDILFQFLDVDASIDKFSLIALTNFDYSSPNKLVEIKNFIKSCGDSFKKLYENGESFKIDNNEFNIKAAQKLQEVNILSFKKYGDKINLKI